MRNLFLRFSQMQCEISIEKILDFFFQFIFDCFSVHISCEQIFHRQHFLDFLEWGITGKMMKYAIKGNPSYCNEKRLSIHPLAPAIGWLKNVYMCYFIEFKIQKQRIFALLIIISLHYCTCIFVTNPDDFPGGNLSSCFRCIKQM